MVQPGGVSIYEDNRTYWAGFSEIYFVNIKAVCSIQNRFMTNAVSYMSLKIQTIPIYIVQVGRHCWLHKKWLKEA